MADTLSKVKPGDPLVIPAPAYNAFVDAAKDYQNRQRNQAAGMKPTPSSQTAVLVKNIGDVDCPRFGVLAISGPLIDPADNAGAFAEQVAFAATKPAGTGVEPFVVALEPVPIGKVGRAVCAGVAIVKVNVSDDAHDYARLSDGVVANMVSCKAASLDHPTPGETSSTTKGGPCVRIIWREGGTGVQYAVIHVEIPKPHDWEFDDWISGECPTGHGRWDAQGRKVMTEYYVPSTGKHQWIDLSNNVVQEW